MSAPATEQPPVDEQPTQPLPIPGTERLPKGHGAFKESGLWLFPGAPVAAVVVGIPIHGLWIYTDDAMFTFAVTGAAGVFVMSFVVFLFARVVSRGEDGRS